MESVIRSELLDVLAKTVVALNNKDSVLLAELSDHTMKNASLYQDEDSVSVAVLLYALGKIVQHCIQSGKNYDPILAQVRSSLEALQNSQLGKYNQALHAVFEHVEKLDHKLKLYVQDVLDKAKIKKGSRLYEHGISLSRAAAILGISQWELMSYVGKTTEAETALIGLSVKKRLGLCRELFA